MDPLFKTHNAPADARARIAAQLASYYSELADLGEPQVPFSLARYLLSQAQGRPATGRELEVISAAALMLGQHFDPCRAWMPLRVLGTRAMGTIPGGKGGYMVAPDTMDPVDVLRPWSVVASAGAQILVGLTEGIVLPRTTTAVTASWLGENTAGPSEAPPTLGNVSLAPKQAIALVKFSMQLLRQGEAVEAYLRAQLLAAVGELLDKAFFAGAGVTEPLGLLSTTGIGTQSGTSLAHAGLLAMRKGVVVVGGREENLQWVGTPATQEVLAGRVRETGATGGGRFLWDDNGILGKPAYATKNAPTAGLIVGDFAQSTVGIFGPGIRIDIDPSQDFNSAGLVARVLLMCDVAFPQPAAFTVATSVT